MMVLGKPTEKSEPSFVLRLFPSGCCYGDEVLIFQHKMKIFFEGGWAYGNITERGAYFLKIVV